MKKIAFVFPGQGSQYMGMGKDIYANHSGAREIFEEADRALNRKLSEFCFNGPEESLKDTRNAQPGILTVSIALLQIIKEAGIKPDYTAGHSLGEYSALVASGALDFTAAVKLVQKRAELMAGADPEQKGAMGAVLGLDRESLAACLSAAAPAKVEAANFNCPGQIVISGEKSGISRVQEQVVARGGKFIPLAVSGPFHSSFMKSAADSFRDHLGAVAWNRPTIPVVANVSAKIHTPESLIDNLYRQIFSPVLWEESINYLVHNDVDVFVEIGPGKVLSGLIKKTVKEVIIINCEDLASSKKALAILKEV